MDTAQGKLAFQVQFWGLIGPLIALITSFVILIKSPPEAVYLSITTIIGLVVSWKWKMQGALASIGMMLLFYLYHFSEIDPNEHLWHLGMNFSIILGFAITALSLQEVEELIHLEEKSDSLPVDNAKSDALIPLQQEIVTKAAQLTSYGTLVETMRKEATQATKQHEKLLQEFMNKQLELSHIQESLHAAKQEVELFSNKLKDDAEEKKLKIQLEVKLNEIATLKKELEFLKVQKEVPAIKEVSSGTIDLEAFSELKTSNELLSRERGRLESLLFRTQIDLHQKTQDLAHLPRLETEIENLKLELKNAHEVQNALKEKLSCPNELEGELQSLKEQLALITKRKDLLDLTVHEKEHLLSQEKNAKIELETQKNDLEEQLKAKLQQEVIVKAHLQKLETQLKEESSKEKRLTASLEEKNQSLAQEQSAKSDLEALKIHLEEQLKLKFKQEEEILNNLKEMQKKLDEESFKEKKFLISLDEKEQFLQKEIEEKQALLAFNENLKGQLEEKIKQEKEQEDTTSLISSKNLPFMLKKIEGRYLQLKEQFKLKSEILDQTRKELFQREESLQEAKLHLNELQLYHYSDSESAMQAYLLNVIEESNQKINHLEKEIEELQALIQSLLSSEP